MRVVLDGIEHMNNIVAFGASIEGEVEGKKFSGFWGDECNLFFKGGEQERLSEVEEQVVQEAYSLYRNTPGEHGGYYSDLPRGKKYYYDGESKKGSLK